MNRDELRAQLRLPLDAPVIALLPGSRQSEIDMMAPLFIDTARLILERVPGRPLRGAAGHARDARALRGRGLARGGARTADHDALRPCAGRHRRGDVALATSGTVTLEAALLRRPMVIAYRVSPITAAIVRRLVLVPYVGLPNILTGDWLVPELCRRTRRRRTRRRPW